MNFLVVLVPTGICGSNSRMHYIYGIGTYNGRFQWCFYVFSLHTWDSPRGLIPTAFLKPWNPLLVGCKAGLRCCLGGCVETTNQDMFCFSIITSAWQSCSKKFCKLNHQWFPIGFHEYVPNSVPPRKKKVDFAIFSTTKQTFPWQVLEQIWWTWRRIAFLGPDLAVTQSSSHGLRWYFFYFLLQFQWSLTNPK